MSQPRARELKDALRTDVKAPTVLAFSASISSSRGLHLLLLLRELLPILVLELIVLLLLMLLLLLLLLLLLMLLLFVRHRSMAWAMAATCGAVANSPACPATPPMAKASPSLTCPCTGSRIVYTLSFTVGAASFQRRRGSRNVAASNDEEAEEDAEDGEDGENEENEEAGDEEEDKVEEGAEEDRDGYEGDDEERWSGGILWRTCWRTNCSKAQLSHTPSKPSDVVDNEASAAAAAAATAADVVIEVPLTKEEPLRAMRQRSIIPAAVALPLLLLPPPPLLLLLRPLKYCSATAGGGGRREGSRSCEAWSRAMWPMANCRVMKDRSL